MMDFSSEDGVKWTEKKYNKISLTLGLSDKSDETTDQTPTPTRFLRNCEEVGLFQDLQHVNPFDETFKKAIQSKNNGTPLQTLGIPETSGDDTLHTPHIFPPLEEICDKPRSRKESIDDITLVIDDNVVPISYDHGVEKPQPSTTSNTGTTLGATNEEHTHKTGQLDQVVTREASNGCQNNKKDVSQSHDDCVIITPASENHNNSADIQSVISKNTEHFIKKRLAVQQVRERNRKSQERLRSRRKINQKRMEFNYRFLQSENAKLKAENIYLREELIRLKGQAEEQSNPTDNGNYDVTSHDMVTKKSGTSSLNMFTRETPIFPKPVPGTPREEFILPKNSSAGPALILPKPPNTVFLQLPVLQTQTLPIVLANSSQLITLQNPPIQATPRKILPLLNQVVGNGQAQNNAVPNVATSTPTPKKSKKRKRKK